VTVTRTHTILDRIVADTRDLLAVRRRATPLAVVQERAAAAQPPVPFAAALRRPRLAVIAEVKKASPVRGVFDPDLDPVARALAYARGGAAAVSVLTEPRHFLGELAFLTAIRDGLEARGVPCPPLLRKDFLFDPYQLYEARAHGADAVLLIVAVLGDPLLADLIALARQLGMDALVEVHDEGEVARALTAGADLIGINNRDLRTFRTDLATTARLRPLIPAGKVVVSESGIGGAADAAAVRAMGVDAVLVGESLMTAPDVGAALTALMVG
jgi:indole-3-glycerol phosphate synthase